MFLCHDFMMMLGMGSLVHKDSHYVNSILGVLLWIYMHGLTIANHTIVKMFPHTGIKRVYVVLLETSSSAESIIYSRNVRKVSDRHNRTHGNTFLTI